MCFTHRYPVLTVPISQMFQRVPQWGGKQTGTQEFQAGEPSPTMNLFSDIEQGASPL